MGALAQELGGSPRRGVGGHQRAAGSAPDPGQAEPDRACPQRRTRRLHGAELEIGWLPVLLQQSGNAKCRPGSPATFAAADYVRKLEVPSQVDRSQGDVHASGNPHIQTDPRNIALVAAALGAAAAAARSGASGEYAKAQADFAHRWRRRSARWTAQAAPAERRARRLAAQGLRLLYWPA